MKPEMIETLRMRWLRLRIYRRPGTVLVDYRIIRNFTHIYLMAGQQREHSIPGICTPAAHRCDGRSEWGDQRAVDGLAGELPVRHEDLYAEEAQSLGRGKREVGAG